MADWGEAVLNAAHLCFAVLELDMRSAQNTLRLKRALTSEGLPFEKLRFVAEPRAGLHRPERPRAGQADGRSRSASPSRCSSPTAAAPVAAGRRPRRAAGRSRAQERAPPEIAKLAKSIHEVNLADAAPQKARARA